ncbi:microtubule-associated protein TORTIFOLIA1 [Melia azedarach]|uniref:Microtubule-associated protein TORTIFOLIA1 n=1 Tax=Melia azedarach TaxID=155640 RepID=A0ACC1XD70_MELAZ|nr:microtubule-associated protein TORTIFOLIA1 [Melia azedarach]
MRGNSHMKARGPSRVNGQQVTFELKQKVILALNKLADRDTYQIGVDELDKLAECLTPDKIALFVSCILDTDSEQKSAVRKECIRLMGTLARFHHGLVGQHLNKMVASIVKRLKDSDSVVRDACVETMGVLASKLSNRGDETDGVFVALVRPLFEALGEQNKQVQSGAALCLARVIDNTRDPPGSILQRMLTRTIKLLKNPHFMGKPAVIELNRSIIMAGGAATQNVLSAAMVSIQDALKNSDWATRKAASVALGEIASSGGSFLGILKTSCIRSLESCRFDKVKPVRETVLHALQYWRGIPGPDTPEPSEAGSSVKENFCGGDFSGLISPNDYGRKDAPLKKVADSDRRRIPLSIRKTCQSYTDHLQQSKPDGWHIEIAVPKTHNVSVADVHNEDSEDSCVTKTLERMSVDVTSMQDIENEYVPMDDKQECSAVSNLATENFETKFVTVSHECLEEGDLLKSTGRKQCFRAEEIGSEEQIYSAKMQDRRSLDSTVTESSSQTVRGCCLQMENEMACIRKQLLEIENKQSSLMDLFRVFSVGIMDSLSMLQSKVLGLEHVVDRIGQELVHGGRHSDLSSSKYVKQSQSAVPSPRLSTCSSRPSVDIRNRPSLVSVKNSEIWEEKTFGRSRSSNVTKEGTEMWTNHPTLKSGRNPTGKDSLKSSGLGIHAMGQIRKTNSAFASAVSANPRIISESKNNLWQCVKGYLCEGDLDSAYVEALSAGDELVLVELLDRTGPVLDSLSHKTISDLLSTLASYFLEQRFMNSIIPWLQQVVDLSALHGSNYLVPSTKARREFLSAIQETLKMEFSNPAERRSITQLVMKLCQVWGNCC